MERVILHSDMNNFFASVELLSHPELAGCPVAVAGDVEKRHGIVLAKNNIAKGMGVRTGEPLWQAKRKCPKITFLPPHYELYEEYSRRAKEIYYEYTDMIEPFGMDECWLDVSGSVGIFGDGRQIADLIRQRIRRELGLTVSVGVSFNKVFAKLGSDIKKPDATTVISRENFKELVWGLPASDMLFVGPKSSSKLKLYGIKSIGDLACADPHFLKALLGKNGILLHDFANGHDISPVAIFNEKAAPKSIGNSTTAPRDLVSADDVNIILYRLCENVSRRLRVGGLVCRTVQVSVRYCDLRSCERQIKLDYPNRTAQSIFEAARSLMSKRRLDSEPIRSLGVRATDIFSLDSEQLSLSPDIMRIQRTEAVENVVDGLRARFGDMAVRRGIMFTDIGLSSIALSSSGLNLSD